MAGQWAEMLGSMVDVLWSNGQIYFVLTTVSCVLLGLLIFAIYKSQCKRSALQGIPKPPGHWLYGNLHQLPLGGGFNEVNKWTEEYGGTFILRIGPFVDQVIFNDPQEAKILLATTEPKGHSMYRMLTPWIGDGLLMSKGQKWARNRRLLTPAFHFDILKPYQKLFSKSAMTMVHKWQAMLREDPDKSVEMFEHVSLMTLDGLMKCIFGLEGGSQNGTVANHPYVKAVYDLTHMLLQRFYFLPYHIDLVYYMSYSGYKFRKTCAVAHQFTQSVIKRKKEEKTRTRNHSCPEKKYVDFIDMLLDCRDDDGKGLDDKEIQDEVDTFMFEGHDTTASAISWCLYNLAANTDCQEKCRQEVLTVVGDHDEVTWDDLSRLTYLTMCIKESLRTHPPVPVIGRVLTKPLTLPSGIILPTGTWCVCTIHGLNSNPNVWNDSKKYLPERFSRENLSGRHSHASIPFSAGPRNCIGQHFAMNEMKTAIALVLRYFKLTVDPEKPADKMMKIVLRSTNGLWLYLQSL